MANEVTALHRCPDCYRNTRKERCAVCEAKRRRQERDRVKFTPLLADIRNTLAAEAAAGGWAVETGAGNRFSNETFDDAMSPGSCWLMATSRVAVPDKPGYELIVRISLNVSMPRDSYFRKCAYRGARVEGETEYQEAEIGAAPKGWWHGWVRTGVDCASVWLEKRTEANGSPYYNNLAALLDGETARCVNSEVRSRTLKAVPGTGFSRQPEWFEKAAADLKAGRVVSLRPSGFGTGYVLYTGRQRTTYDKRAATGLEKALGVAPIFMQEMDCD